jgi:hypothetical protein
MISADRSSRCPDQPNLYVVMPMRTRTSSRKWLTAVLLLLTAAVLGSCSSRNCGQPDLEDAIFNTPWSTDTEPDRAFCRDRGDTGTLEFIFSYDDDPIATQRAQRLQMAAHQAGMTTSSTGDIGSFTAALPGSDIALSVAVDRFNDWGATIYIYRGFGEESGIHPISPELQALLDAVATTN